MKIFIGFDPNEVIAYHVLANSIMRHASLPVSITPLILSQLPMIRPRDPHQSTEFAFSRFLVPWLCGYQGLALFLDADMLVRADIAELFFEADLEKAVSVVQHDYQANAANKFLDQEQTRYRRKNWSSVMLFNNAKCKALTPAYVNYASGLELHQFAWLRDEEIGKLDPAWNHLVAEYPPNPDAKLIHFTRGTPCFKKFQSCEFSDEWYAERSRVLYYNPIGEYSKPEQVAA